MCWALIRKHRTHPSLGSETSLTGVYEDSVCLSRVSERPLTLDEEMSS